MSQATQALPPAVSPGVLDFAAAQGVTAYLPAVLEMTRRLFPGAPLQASVEDDPEIPNDRHLVIEALAATTDVPEALEQIHAWHRAVYSCCPAPLVTVFRLGLEMPP